MAKCRADTLLLRQGLCADRETALRLIMAGAVRVGTDKVIRKPGELLPDTVCLRVRPGHCYASRAAAKLLPALLSFRPSLEGVVALDIGASTGGFTDLLLRSGARRVYAVDVGYGLLHHRLRTDPRVVCLERLNARRLDAKHIPEAVDLLTVDVSFISVAKVLPAAAVFLRPGGWAFVLVKPQFEAPREDVGVGGIVRRDEVRRNCLTRVHRFVRACLGWEPVGLVTPATLGRTGNQEYVAVFRGEELAASRKKSPEMKRCHSACR
ncbi:MAG: TlyA family RNA methyltransferase [Kiritimatiellaeota bacterium]|nr:TlyA family RNA methyltransferase [Kiritimatiellota bacterium]